MTSSTTVNHNKEERMILTERQYQILQLKCIGLLAAGNSIADISQSEGLTVWHTRQVLDRINKEARDSLLTSMISDRVPLSVEVSLETHRILIKKCMHILNTSKDDRVVLQAAAQISSLVAASNEILSSANMIAGAIKKVLVIHPNPNPNPPTTAAETSIDMITEEEAT